MQTVGQQLIISAIPVLPALVFFVLVLFGRLLKENAQFVAILGVTVSLVFSVFALLFVAGVIPGGGQPIEFSVNWIDLGEGGSFPVGVYIDGLAAVMLVVVCFVSLMIQLYSGGFMEGDPRFAWYYAVLNLFTASMLGLVVAPNYAIVRLDSTVGTILQRNDGFVEVGRASVVLTSFEFTLLELASSGNRPLGEILDDIVALATPYAASAAHAVPGFLRRAVVPSRRRAFRNGRRVGSLPAQ
jgi:hypothetical protein